MPIPIFAPAVKHEIIRFFSLRKSKRTFVDRLYNARNYTWNDFCFTLNKIVSIGHVSSLINMYIAMISFMKEVKHFSMKIKHF